MHEQQQGRKTEELVVANSRYDRYWLPAVYGEDRLGTPAYIYRNDRSSGSYDTYLFDKEFTHNIAIIATSAGCFGAGIGILIQRIFGG